ncbi:hypothetical protein CYMTET_28719 [Cymbomonas tetramitiformis]|uniref:Uncharacterized protein n=1 Tax=Cymbomonas tetramitiformis TaxID=36881 RepID=A0AAE0KVM3_9CHLO|nr:hypothetical protein CYMTET_28719 [Cymbomonas tetramitiformis]
MNEIQRGTGRHLGSYVPFVAKLASLLRSVESNRSALCIAAGRGLCVAGAGVAEGGLDGAPAAAPPRLQRSAAQCAVPAPAQRLHEPSPGGRVHTAGGALSGAAASGFARGGGALRSLAQAPAREGGLLRGMAPWRMASWDLGSAAVAQRLAGRRFQVLSTMTHGNDDDKPSVSRIAAGTLHQSITIQRRRIGDTQAPSAQNLNPGSHKPDPRLGRPVIRKRLHPSARGAPVGYNVARSFLFEAEGPAVSSGLHGRAASGAAAGRLVRSAHSNCGGVGVPPF